MFWMTIVVAPGGGGGACWHAAGGGAHSLSNAANVPTDAICGWGAPLCALALALDDDDVDPWEDHGFWELVLALDDDDCRRDVPHPKGLG